MCKCDCGKILLVKHESLNFKRDCGCKTTKRKAKLYNRKYGESTFTYLYRIHKVLAAKRKHSYLAKELWRQLVSQPCYYCGALDKKNKYSSESTRKADAKYFDNSDFEKYTVFANGIDRVDSSKGYTPGNSVPCCRRCNYIKNKYSQREFIEHCLRIVNYTKISEIRLSELCSQEEEETLG